MPSDPRDKRPSDTGKAVVREVKKEKTTGPIDKWMDKWAEPALATKASYEDHNGVPYGVMEHMQPLGEAPNGKVRARVRPDGGRKSVAGRSAVNAQPTPEGTPQPPTQSQAQAQTQRRQHLKVEQPTPPPPPPAKSPAISQEVESVPVALNASQKEPARKPRALKKRWEIDRILRPEDCTNAKIVEVIIEAKQRANAANNPELADAVQELYEESLQKPRLRTVLVKVLTQTASPSDLEEFQSYVKAAKRRLAARKAAATQTTSGEISTTTATTTTARKPSKPESKSASISHSQAAPAKKVASAPAKTGLVAAGKVQQKPGTTKAQATSQTSTTVPRVTPRASSRPRNRSMHDDSEELSELTDLADEDSDISGLQDDDGDVVVVDAPPITKQRQNAKAGASAKAQPAAANVRMADVQPGKADQKRRASALNTGAAEVNPKERAAARKSREASRASLTVPQKNLKRSSEEAELDSEALSDIEFHAKKQKLSSKVKRDGQYEESNIRSARVPSSRKTRVHARTSGIDGSDNQMRHDLALDNYSDMGSPLSSPTVSHRNTPPPVTLKARTGKRAKTKQSPEKKQTHARGPLSGLGGATGSNSPMDVDDSDAEASDNDDFCSACAGSGQLLCCDGCEHSFHFICLDPPLAHDAEELNEPWFCYQCVAKKRSMGEAQAETQRFSLFAPLLANLAKRNPTTFALPPEVQNHFEGVGADTEGNFANVPRPGKKKAGFGDPVDLYKLRDGKGKILFCYNCQQTSHGTRQVVQCDECNQVWHLDCLDPPLAIHPCITGDGRKVADWLCPLHIEHELRQVEARRFFNQHQGRKLHVRKPRGAKPVETFLSRGASNNGLIEVKYLESSDDESDSEFYLEEDPRRDAVILKVPDSGIKLDFIAKVKQDRIQHYRDRHFDLHAFGKAQGSRVQMVNTRRLPAATNTLALARRSLREQQTALNLAQFAQADTNKDLGLGQNNVETLIAGLMAEAPAKILSRMDATGPCTEVSNPVEKGELLALQKLIARRLEELKT